MFIFCDFDVDSSSCLKRHSIFNIKIQLLVIRYPYFYSSISINVLKPVLKIHHQQQIKKHLYSKSCCWYNLAMWLALALVITNEVLHIENKMNQLPFIISKIIRQYFKMLFTNCFSWVWNYLGNVNFFKEMMLTMRSYKVSCIFVSFIKL